MNSGHQAVRELLGGYLVGGLDEADQHLVDAHLRTCAPCRDELDLLGPVPELLSRLRDGLPSEARPASAPSPRQVEDLLSRMRARRRRMRRSLLTVVAAAAVMLAVGAGVALRSAEPGGTTIAFAPVAGSAAAGQAVLSARPWGTAVTVKVSGLPPTGPCALEVIGRDGRVERAATWGPTATRTVQVTGASSMPLSMVRAVDLLSPGGTVLATAPASQSPPAR